MARIVVEHPETGQRIAVDEHDFDNPDAHPQNHDHVDYSTQFGGNGATVESHHAGRTGAARKSLKAEGYIPMAYQDDRSRETPIGEPITDQERESMTRQDILDRQALHLKLLKERARGEKA